ncbi:MAG: pyridoxine 5'-phosphate synthase [Alphaproteobacteria bacterium]|nr:pyridoxine 5'-phosphate synthase [Alphaproteobacteria bacterium]
MTKLSVNLNAVAQLRNRRTIGWPDVTRIGRMVLDAGADGLTVHPRPDERHIRRQDVFDLKALLDNYPSAEFNIEGYPADPFLELVETVVPDQVTLVPDDPSQSTSDHGWPIPQHEDFLRRVIERLHAADIRVSLFVDEDPAMAGWAHAVGADRIELYTGPYGAAHGTANANAHLARLADTARAARAVGLGVNAGHDLTLTNLPTFIIGMPTIDETSIGHGITADALEWGFPETVRRYIAALSKR